MKCDLARVMYFSNDSITHEEIAAELGMSQKAVMTAVCDCGIRQRDIVQRQKDKWLRKYRATFTLDDEGQLERCAQCDMFMINLKDLVPPGWAWGINGRIGDICRACEKEMNTQQKKRFTSLRDIGCIVCRLENGVHSQPEIHHVRDTLGVGQKRDHDRTIPLCPTHHRLGGYGVARHEGLPEWEKRHGSEVGLLDMVNTILEMLLQS